MACACARPNLMRAPGHHLYWRRHLTQTSEVSCQNVFLTGRLLLKLRWRPQRLHALQDQPPLAAIVSTDEQVHSNDISSLFLGTWKKRDNSTMWR